MIETIIRVAIGAFLGVVFMVLLLGAFVALHYMPWF